MKYQVEMLIRRDIQHVSALYVDKTGMLVWEKGLKAVESHVGTLFETGSQGDLIFVFGDHEMRMHVTVESSHLPDEITLIYEVKGAWNRCVNQFIAHPEGTRWIMDVEFRFEAEPNVPLERFMEQTQAGMMLFRDYVEMRKND